MRTPSIATTDLVPCILTFVTATGRRCFYATRISPEGWEDRCDQFSLPYHVQSQLDAVNARLAWKYVRATKGVTTSGPGAAHTQPIAECGPDEFERLIFR